MFGVAMDSTFCPPALGRESARLVAGSSRSSTQKTPGLFAEKGSTKIFVIYPLKFFPMHSERIIISNKLTHFFRQSQFHRIWAGLRCAQRPNIPTMRSRNCSRCCEWRSSHFCFPKLLSFGRSPLGSKALIPFIPLSLRLCVNVILPSESVRQKIMKNS